MSFAFNVTNLTLWLQVNNKIYIVKFT